MSDDTIIGLALLIVTALGVLVAWYTGKDKGGPTNKATGTGSKLFSQAVADSPSTFQVSQGDGSSLTVSPGASTDEVVSAVYNATRGEISEKDEEIKRLNEVIEALNEQSTVTPSMRAEIEKALALIEKGDTEAAEKIFTEIKVGKINEGHQSFKEAAAAARHIGALLFSHDTQKALSAYREATELDPDHPDGWNNLGQLFYRIGDLASAEDSLQRVLALGNQVEDRTLIALATANLGNIAFGKGDFDAAEGFYRNALEIQEALGIRPSMATQYGNLGNIALVRSELDSAEEFFNKSLAIHIELENKSGQADDYSGLGTVFYERNDFKAAETLHKQALEINEELERQEVMVVDFGNLGIIAANLGELDVAEDFYSRCLILSQKIDHKYSVANAYLNLGMLSSQRGDSISACNLWTRGKKLFEEIGDHSTLKKIQSIMDDAGCSEIESPN